VKSDLLKQNIYDTQESTGINIFLEIMNYSIGI